MSGKPTKAAEKAHKVKLNKPAIKDLSVADKQAKKIKGGRTVCPPGVREC